MATKWEQKQTLRDIIDGLNAAIDVAGLTPEDIDPIKLNKLLYLAVNHFDLPVTYWWYKYGSDFTFHGIGTNALQPRALEELSTPTQPRLGPDDLDEGDGYPSPKQYKEFFLTEVNDFERLFEDDTKEYLRAFYQDYAPEDLQDIYTACAIFQKTMDSIGYADEPGTVVTTEIGTAMDELRQLNREVHINPLLDDVREPYKEYTELLKDVLVTVDSTNGELDGSEEALRDVVRFFYDAAWQIIAFKIASENSHGSDAFERKETANGRLQTLLNNWDRDIDKLRSKSVSHGLVSEDLQEYHAPPAREADQDDKQELINRARREWDGVSWEAERDL